MAGADDDDYDDGSGSKRMANERKGNRKHDASSGSGRK